MSLFKNRIPGNSVSFSAEPYELPFLMSKSKEELQEEKAIIEKSEAEIQLEDSYVQLELRQQELLKEQQKINEAYEKIEAEKQSIEQLKQGFALEQEQWEQTKLQDKQEFEAKKQEFEKEKVKMYYEICEFMWEQSIEVAEKIVHQAIKTDQISIMPLLEETIKQLPVAFEKLSVIVHPETIGKLKEEQNGTKSHWLLDNLEWKYDLSLQIGEFIIEEEKEFFEYRFRDVFQMLQKKLNDRKYIGEENSD